MGGCAKNGSDGSESSEGHKNLLMMMGAMALGIEERNVRALYIAPDRVFIKVTLSGIQHSVITNTLRAASQTYWNDLVDRGISDALFTFQDKSFALLDVQSEAEARDIIQGDPIVKAGGFKSVEYELVHPKAAAVAAK